MIDLPKKLRITAGVINMGGRIAWGSDTALMEEAAKLIEQQQAEIYGLKEQLPKWVGADSKFPNSDQECLVVLGNENVCLATWDADAGAFDSIGINWITEYTHWMPLPQPPKEGNNE